MKEIIWKGINKRSKKRESNNIIVLKDANDNEGNHYISANSYKFTDEQENNQTEFFSNLMDFKEEQINIEKDEPFELPIDAKEELNELIDPPIEENTEIPIYKPEAFDSPAKFKKKKKIK